MRRLPLPPSWVRRCDWHRHGDAIEIIFPCLDHDAEVREIDRLLDWSERSERNAGDPGQLDGHR
jgi:hypothetical protein